MTHPPDERGITLRYVIGLVTTVAITLGVFTALAALFTYRDLDDRVRDQAAQQSSMLATSIASQVWDVDREGAGDLLDAFMLNDDVVLARVTAGRQLLAERGVPEARALEAYHDDSAFIVESMDVTYASADGPVVVGHVDVVLSRKRVTASMQRHLWLLLATGCAVCVAVAAASVILTRLYVQRPLLALKSAAEAANRSKSDFLANMSHEIRTPMTAILGFCDLLDDGVEPPEERRRWLNTIRSNGEHLLTILNDILDLSRIEAGRLNVARRPCDVRTVVREVVETMRVKADDKGLDIIARFDGLVPAAIFTDETRLRQILVNLLGNAVKFTERGSITVVVRVDGHGEARQLAFDVTDSGPGLEAEQLASLFDPFTQGDPSTTRRHGGAGLGLSISRRLARMLGGDVLAASWPGIGSTFTATVATGPLEGVDWLNPGPVDPATPPEDHGPFATSRTAVETSARLAGRRVLVAEDTSFNQELFTKLLERAGAEVAVAANGQEAVDSALAAETGTPFDVLLMDMQMPVLDGYEAVTQLREQGYARPIIALTAHTMRGDRERCLDAGCDEYMSKPIDPRGFVDLIATLAERSAAPENAETPKRRNAET